MSFTSLKRSRSITTTLNGGGGDGATGGRGDGATGKVKDELASDAVVIGSPPRPVAPSPRRPLPLAGRAHPEPALNGELLRAIYLLERRRDEAPPASGYPPVLLERTAPEEALFALLQQAICLTLKDRARNRHMMESYMALANAVPTFRLSYPTGLGYVDTILDRLTLHGASLATDSGMRTDR